MKTLKIVIMLGSFLPLMACGTFKSSEDAANESSSSTTTAESDEEAMVNAAIDSLNLTTSASSADVSASYSALTTANASLIRHRFRCADTASHSEVFSCDAADGSVEHVVTLTDCTVSDWNRTAVVNGTFTNTVTNGGDGLCSDTDSLNFAHMVMGRTDDEGNAVNAVATHTIGEDGLVVTFVNIRGAEVTLTITGSRQVTYSGAVDSNGDGGADTVSATVEKDFNHKHVVADHTFHDVDVFTSEEGFSYTAEDGTILTATPTFPIHKLTLTDDKVSTRTITVGNLIVDHNLAKIRMVFGVGAEGLTFDDGTTCGPTDGTLTITGYTISDDGIGAVIGTGVVTFSDGEVVSADFDGTMLAPRPRPCS